jgi:hypothetical protein
LPHQREKNKKQNKQTKNPKKPNQNKRKIPSSNAIQFQLFLQLPVLVLSLSHKRRRKKKKSLVKFCEWLSEAVACLLAAVSLLLLEALFMQISGMSLTLT